jgi:hypothetical protein
MSGRKVVDERDARASLAALARSGETLRDWARRNGVDGRSLRAWQINLSRGAGRPRLVELVPRTAETPTRGYVVRVGRGSVEIGDDFDSFTLARIVEVLQSC